MIILCMYLLEYIYLFGFGSGLNQNHTKNIPQICIFRFGFGFGFGFGFWSQTSIKNKPERTKNVPKIKPTFLYNIYSIERDCWSRFIDFWYFRFIFDAGSASKTKQKPNIYMYSSKYLHNNILMYDIFLKLKYKRKWFW